MSVPSFERYKASRQMAGIVAKADIPGNRKSRYCGIHVKQLSLSVRIVVERQECRIICRSPQAIFTHTFGQWKISLITSRNSAVRSLPAVRVEDQQHLPGPPPLTCSFVRGDRFPSCLGTFHGGQGIVGLVPVTGCCRTVVPELTRLLDVR